MRETTSIISYAPNTMQSFVLQEQPDLQFATLEDLIHYTTHNLNNKMHSDGRIYLKLTKDHELYANSVSPYAEHFLDNLEYGIKPLVMAFNQKRYLTYSSCEGHGMSFRRYVGLAFADIETRQYVASQILSLKLPGVKVQFFDSVCNQHVQAGNKNIPDIIKYTDESLHNMSDALIQEQEVLTFNIQFHRQYEEYFFLEIIILDAIPYSGWHGLKLMFYHMWLRFLKTYYWDKITAKVLALVTSSEFKKYPY